MTDDFIQRVKDANDIVDVISEYLNLKKAGKNYVGICPFHADGTPSLRVYPNTQSFYCFGCGAGKAEEGGNDVISFIAKIKGLEFEDAVKELSDRAGIDFEDKPDPNTPLYNKYTDSSRDLYMELYTNEEALRYLYSRGLTDADINTWRIGFSKNDVYFHDRIIFPILDIKKRTVGFTSRRFPDELNIEKCKHSPTSAIFKRNSLLYGIHEAYSAIKETGQVYITEGPFDCIAMHIMGFTNTVATLGCHMSDEQIAIIEKLGAHPIIAYDGDTEGMKHNIKTGGKFLERGVSPSIVVFPEGLDPNDFMLKHTDLSAAREELMANTVDYCYFMIEQQIRVYDSKILEAKRDFYNKAYGFVDSIPEGTLKHSMLDFINERIQGGLQLNGTK